VTNEGQIKIVDFGIWQGLMARTEAPAQSSEDSMVTESMPTLEGVSGRIIGTPAYMAPEIWMGSGHDIRIDLFAFGIVLYEMLTGRRLLTRSRWSVEAVNFLLDSLDIDELWPYGDIVTRLLAPAPEDRYQEPNELIGALLKAEALHSETSRNIGSAQVQRVPLFPRSVRLEFGVGLLGTICGPILGLMLGRSIEDGVLTVACLGWLLSVTALWHSVERAATAIRGVGGNLE